MQIANVQSGTGSNNVIPGDMFVQFNFRFSTELTDEMIKSRVIALLEKYQLRYSVEWWLSGQPFLTGRASWWMRSSTRLSTIMRSNRSC